MPEKPPLRPEEVRRILRELAPLSEDRRIILVGGQAVAFWAAFFKQKPRSAEQEIFTSKDIDFEGAARTARMASELLDGEVRIPTIDDHTPNTGIVLFEDSDGEMREIDFLVAPLRLRRSRCSRQRSAVERVESKRAGFAGLGHAPRAVHGEPRLQRGRSSAERSDCDGSAPAVGGLRQGVLALTSAELLGRGSIAGKRYSYGSIDSSCVSDR